MNETVETPFWRRFFHDPAHLMAYAVGVVLVIGIVGLFTARPAYRALKRSRAQTQVRLAEEALAADRTQEAQRSCRLALALAPAEPSVLRLAARVCTRAHDRAAVDFWRSYLSTASASRAERIEAIEAMRRMGRPDLSKQFLEKMLAASPEDRELRLLSIDLKVASQDSRAAIREARELLRTSPDDEAIQVRLGIMLCDQPFATSRAEGKRLLWPIAVGNGPEQASATLALAEQPELTQAETQVLIRRLSEVAQPSFGQRLALISLRFNARPEERELRVAEARQLSTNSLAPGQIRGLANLFISLGAAREVLQLVPEERARADFRLGRWRAKALANLNEWDELQALVRDPSFVAPEIFRTLHLALAASGKGAEAQADELFSRALTSCNAETHCLSAVATMADDAGRQALALRALEQAVRNPEFLRDGVAQRMQIASKVRDARALLPLLKQLAELYPEMSQLRLDYAYAVLLLNPRDSAAQETTIELSTKHPKDPTYAVALGLALVSNGQPQAALKLFDDTDIDWREGRARWSAVRVAALGAAGQAELARRVAATVNTNDLLVQEYDLIRPWLSPPSNAPPP